LIDKTLKKKLKVLISSNLLRIWPICRRNISKSRVSYSVSKLQPPRSYGSCSTIICLVLGGSVWVALCKFSGLDSFLDFYYFLGGDPLEITLLSAWRETP